MTVFSKRIRAHEVLTEAEIFAIKVLFADGVNVKQICEIYGIEPFLVREAVLGADFMNDFDKPEGKPDIINDAPITKEEQAAIKLLFERGMPKKKIMRLFRRLPGQINPFLNPAPTGRTEPGTKTVSRPAKTPTWGDYVPVDVSASAVRYGRANRNAGRVYSAGD